MWSNKVFCGASVALFVASVFTPSIAAARIIFSNMGYPWTEIRVQQEDVCGVPPIKPDIGNSAVNIVGGKEAIPHSWPWQVEVQRRKPGVDSAEDEFVFMCGGSILARRWIVTAAHCLVDYKTGQVMSPDNIRVVVGEHDRSKPEQMKITIKPKDIHVHEMFNPKALKNDIGLIELETEIPFNDYIRPICLPTVIVFKPGTKCVATGWGLDRFPPNYARYGLKDVHGDELPDKLKEVVVPIYSQTECAEIYDPWVDDSMICAGYAEGGKGVCFGDLGGPLMCQEADGVWHLVGITGLLVDCGQPKQPGVFTRVHSFNDWIKKFIY